MGLLPLVDNMAIRFTDSVCAALQIHKNTAGKLKGITLDAEMENVLNSSAESEFVLPKMRLSLQIAVTKSGGVTPARISNISGAPFLGF